MWTVEADSHFDAMTLYFARMGWGLYNTEHESDREPYPDEWLARQKGRPVGVTTFTKLNTGWNAEPNAPEPRISVEGRTLRLSFLLNPFQYEVAEGSVGELRFRECWRYRLGPTNDEGWYAGQCRFSGLAPAWGEFYEVQGDVRDDGSLNWTQLAPPIPASRHFLFYLRDQTFECDADAWEFYVRPVP